MTWQLIWHFDVDSLLDQLRMGLDILEPNNRPTTVH
uniref:Uncharacterized protein n=1 Tax=Arundo donax TaxID=35708 RepID=A0A0A9DZS4_ARUDO